MPQVKKVCRVCGKEYMACCTPNPGIFRWRDVACSPQCGAEYLAMIEALRANEKQDKLPEKKND